MSDATTVTDAGIPVVMPSGAVYLVLSTQEVDYLEERVERYLGDNLFDNIADLQDLDSLLYYELLQWRYQRFLGNGRDWHGKPVSEPELRRTVVEFNNAVRQTKKLLGIDKTARDRAQGEGTVADYIEKVRTFAGRMGVLRNTQLVKALTLTNQLIGLVTLHDNCTESERRHQGVTMDDIIEWIRSVYIPEYMVLDEWFRRRGPEAQQLWIREL